MGQGCALVIERATASCLADDAELHEGYSEMWNADKARPTEAGKFQERGKGSTHREPTGACDHGLLTAEIAATTRGDAAWD